VAIKIYPLVLLPSCIAVHNPVVTWCMSSTRYYELLLPFILIQVSRNLTYCKNVVFILFTFCTFYETRRVHR
jgi:hypothetical protein